jgi:hypothetical protein
VLESQSVAEQANLMNSDKGEPQSVARIKAAGIPASVRVRLVYVQGLKDAIGVPIYQVLRFDELRKIRAGGIEYNLNRERGGRGTCNTSVRSRRLACARLVASPQYALNTLAPCITGDSTVVAGRRRHLVLVHCRSGKNRSPAVCLVAATAGARCTSENEYHSILSTIRAARRGEGITVLAQDTIKNGFENEIRNAVFERLGISQKRQRRCLKQ